MKVTAKFGVKLPFTILPPIGTRNCVTDVRIMGAWETAFPVGSLVHSQGGVNAVVSQNEEASHYVTLTIRRDAGPVQIKVPFFKRSETVRPELREIALDECEGSNLVIIGI